MSDAPLKKPADVAAIFGISPESVIRRSRSGEFPHIRIGQAYRYDAHHIEAIKAAHEVQARQDAPDPWGRITRGHREAS